MTRLQATLTCLLLTSGWLCASPAHAKLMYHLKDLGTLATPPYDLSYGLAINNQGLVVGMTNVSATPRTLDHAFVTDNGTLLDLGSLKNSISSTATAINNAGVIAGYSATQSGYEHAFVKDADATMLDLGTLGGNTSKANGINDNGQITGSSEIPLSSYYKHAFLTTINGGMTDLGHLGGDFSEGLAINASGQVTGESYTADGKLHAFITDADGLNMRDLNVPSYRSSGRGINASGQVVGRAELADGSEHAFVTDADAQNPRILELPNGIEGYASAINDDGIITGSVSEGSFVSDAQGKLRLISSLLISEDSSPNCRVSETKAINNFGQITGFCTFANYNYHAFLLTPEEVAEPRIAAEKSHGDAIKLSESQKDTVKCDKAKSCNQVTTGSYSLTLKLSADTLENNLIDLGKLNGFTPFTVSIGNYAFSGTLNSADPDKKAKTPTALPATWSDSHSVCSKYDQGGGCTKSKTVVDGSVTISSDKKHGLTVTLKGKKSLVDGEDVGQQLLASACQASTPGKSNLTDSAEISIDEWPIPLPLKISCNLRQSAKTVAGSAGSPFALNNISIKAELTTAP